MEPLRPNQNVTRLDAAEDGRLSAHCASGLIPDELDLGERRHLLRHNPAALLRKCGKRLYSLPTTGGVRTPVYRP